MNHRDRGEYFDTVLQQHVLRARQYDSMIGRFSAFDSFEGSGSQPLTIHKYAYANGNPVSRKDPSGHLSYIDILGTMGLAGKLQSDNARLVIGGAKAAIGFLGFSLFASTTAKWLGLALNDREQGRGPFSIADPDAAVFQLNLTGVIPITAGGIIGVGGALTGDIVSIPSKKKAYFYWSRGFQVGIAGASAIFGSGPGFNVRNKEDYEGRSIFAEVGAFGKRLPPGWTPRWASFFGTVATIWMGTGMNAAGKTPYGWLFQGGWGSPGTTVASGISFYSEGIELDFLSVHGGASPNTVAQSLALGRQSPGVFETAIRAELTSLGLIGE